MQFVADTFIIAIIFLLTFLCPFNNKLINQIVYKNIQGEIHVGS